MTISWLGAATSEADKSVCQNVKLFPYFKQKCQICIIYLLVWAAQMGLFAAYFFGLFLYDFSIDCLWTKQATAFTML